MYQLPSLPYAHDALAPIIGADTMRVHHGKHHARYVQVTNELLGAGATKPLEQVMTEAREKGNGKLFNNAAQVWNHAFFWECMSPGGSKPSGAMLAQIEADFGGLEALGQRFVTEGAGHFGSGWVWLVYEDQKLQVTSTHDAANPLTENGGTPILVCDVWEHAYYLDYKNERNRFLESWFASLANWTFAASQLEAAKRGEQGYRFPEHDAR